MTTINILILLLSASPPSEGQVDEYNEQMSKAAKAAIEISGEIPLFRDGYWTCDKSHVFARGQIRSPHMCEVCGSPLFKWVPGPGASDKKPDVILAATRENP